MKPRLCGALLLAAALGVGLVAHGAGGGQKRVLPPPRADAVWRYIARTHPYQRWRLWPGTEAFGRSRSPAHGALLTTRVNIIALSGIERGMRVLPNGAMIVAAGYDAQRRLTGVSVMYRVAGFDPEHADWFWAKYSPEGKAERAGRVSGCIECHGRRAANDYVMGHSLGARPR